MGKSTGIIVLSLVAAGAAAAVILNNVRSDADASVSPTDSEFNANAATEERIHALEVAVSQERRARQLLEDELLALYADIEALQARLESSPAESTGEPLALAAVDGEVSERNQRPSRDNRSTERRESMIEAGLTAERADFILRRESEVRYEAMQAVFAARNAGEAVDRFSPGMNPDAILRNEIGDSDYEKYLEANGRPTSIGVSSVMASSPAEMAGLQSGDEIVGYDGERVFSSFELMQRTMEGGDGNVVIDVVRNGSPMQIVVPRGPIGVEIGRFRGR